MDREAEAADEGEEEEEGEIEEGFVEHEQQALEGAHAGAYARIDNLAREMEERVVNEEEIEKRFGYYEQEGLGAGMEDEVEDVVDAEQIPAQGLQPSLTDPKIWMIKCKPGKEKESVLHIMNRFFLKQELGQSLNIMSVIAPEHTKGFIFVEAEKVKTGKGLLFVFVFNIISLFQEPHVRAAVFGIPDVFSYHTTLVPIAQMTTILRVSNRAAELKSGDWIRIKRGKYTGDLGQVYQVDPSGQKVEIRVMPRLDFSNGDETASASGGQPENKKRKKKTSLADRPKPAPFKLDDLAAMGQQVYKESVENGKTFYQFANERYGEDGYLYKWVNVKSLETQGVTPSLDELEMYHGSTKVRKKEKAA